MPADDRMSTCSFAARIDLLLGEYFDGDGHEVGGGGTPAWAAAHEPLWLLGHGRPSSPRGNGRPIRPIRVGAPAEGELDYAWIMETFAGRRFAVVPAADGDFGAGGDGALLVLLHEDAGPADTLAGYYYAYRASLLLAKMNAARGADAAAAESAWLEAMDAAARARASVEAALDDAACEGDEGDEEASEDAGGCGDNGFARWATMLRDVAGWDTARVLLEDGGWRFTALTFEAGAEEGDEEEEDE